MPPTNPEISSPLPRRPLGRTGREVTLFGLGGEGVLRTHGRMAEAVAVIQRASIWASTTSTPPPRTTQSRDYYGAALGERRGEHLPRLQDARPHPRRLAASARRFA